MDTNEGAPRRSRLLNGAASLIGLAHLAGFAPAVAAAAPPRSEPRLAPRAASPAPRAAAERHETTGRFRRAENDGDGDGDGDSDGDGEEIGGDDPDDENVDENAPREDGRAASPARAAALRERARCAAIVTAPEAARNPGLAAHLAFETGLDQAAAIAALREARPDGGLASRMAAAPDARRVGAGAEPTQGATPAAADAAWDRVMTRHAVPARRRR